MVVNDLIEDRDGYVSFGLFEFLFGVYDGYGGCGCLSIVSEWLFYYIVILLVDYSFFEDIIIGNLGMNNLVNWY